MATKGAQVGNDNAKGKLVTDALRKLAVQNPKRLAKMLDAQLKAAEDGDLQAAQWIADRLDGKAVQGIDLGNADDKPFIIQSSDRFDKL